MGSSVPSSSNCANTQPMPCRLASQRRMNCFEKSGVRKIGEDVRLSFNWLKAWSGGFSSTDRLKLG